MRSLADDVQRFAIRAARRASASALQRFTLAQCAAAFALVALTFALLVARKLSMFSGNSAAESDGAAPFDAGAPGERDLRDAAQSAPP